MAYELPAPGKAYLTYSVQDSPDVSVKRWYNQQGKSYTKWRQWTAYNPPEYESWKAQQLQDYQNYLDAYTANYNAEASTRARLEAAKFNGNYLANGIGGSSASNSGVQAPLYQNNNQSPKGLGKVLQSLELMSAAGVAMKNFGEGKAAMQYADDMAGARLYTEQNKGRGLFFDAGLKELRYNSEFMLQNDPSEYGYKRNESGRWVFDPNNSQGITGRNMRLEAFLQNMESTEAQILLRKQQQQLNQLTYENRQAYEAETMKAQKELLEGKKALQDIEKEYAERMKQLGIAAPIIKMGLETFKLFL